MLRDTCEEVPVARVHRYFLRSNDYIWKLTYHVMRLVKIVQEQNKTILNIIIESPPFLLEIGSYASSNAIIQSPELETETFSTITAIDTLSI